MSDDNNNSLYPFYYVRNAGVYLATTRATNMDISHWPQFASIWADDAIIYKTIEDAKRCMGLIPSARIMAVTAPAKHEFVYGVE